MASKQEIIKQAKADYKKAQKKGDKKAMVKAHATADKARGYSTYTVQTSNGYAQKAKEPKDNYAYQNLKKPTQSSPSLARLGIKPDASQIALKNIQQKKDKEQAKKVGKKVLTAVMKDTFDQNENWGQKAEKGNYVGAAKNFIGAGLTGAQSVYLNTINAGDSLLNGKGMPDFKYQMSFEDYEKEIAKRRGVKPLSEQISKKNEFLGDVFKGTMELSTDPLELTPAGYANDIKLARGANQASEAYKTSLQSGKIGDKAKVKGIKAKSDKKAKGGKVAENTEKIPVIKNGKIVYERKATTETVENTVKKDIAKQPKVNTEATVNLPAKPTTQAPNLAPEPQKMNLGTNIPEEQMFTKNVLKTNTKKYATEPIKDKSNLLGKAYTKLVDNQHALSSATKGIKQTADKDIKILGSNARNVRGTAEYVFRNNLVDMEGKKVGENSLENLLNTTKGEQEAYADYLLNKHNIARYRQDKPIFGGDGVNPPITDKMSEQAVREYEKQYPHFAGKSKKLNEFNGKFIDEWLVKSGLIDDKFGKLLKTMYPDYVPTLRETGGIFEKGFSLKGLKANSGIKKATGGNDPIMAINKSYPIMIQKAMKAARQNELYNGLLDTVLKNPERMSKWAKIIDNGVEKATLDHSLMEMATRAIDDNGIDGIETLAKKQLEIDERTGKYYVTAMKNGKPVRMQVHKDLFDGFNSLNNTRNEGVLDNMANAVGKYATNPFKALITGYNPFFALRNISRDLPTSYIQGTENNPLKWAANLGKAGYHMAKKDDVYNEYLALGGKMNGFFNSEKGLTPAKLPTKILRKTGDVISAFNEATETMPRFGEYLGTVKREGGDYAAKQKGIYNQGEATVNFGRHGDVTKAVDRVVAYLNPSVQGIDKSIRSLSKGSTWAKAIGTVTVPTAAIYAMNNRTPEAKKNYEQLDNRTKDTYFVFPTGDGKYIKIPKSREMGVIFSTLGERLLRAKNGDKNAFKGFGETVATNFGPVNPLENNIFSPATSNLKTNKDFAGREIVPMSMTDEGYGDARSKYLQYDDATSEISKWLGNAMRKTGINNGEGLSPKQIDYIVDSYTGIIGDILLPATTKGQSPTQKVLTKPFTADKLYNNSIQSDFYEKFDEAKRIKSDNNIVNDIPKEWKTPEEKRLSLYTEASIQMSELRKQEKKIMASPIDQKLKEPKLRQIRQQILDIAERTPAEAEKVYRDYKKTYIPEVSMLSEKQREGYDTIKDKVTAKEFADAYKVQKKLGQDYQKDIYKAMEINKLNPNKSSDISKALGLSDNTIKKANRLVSNNISIKQFDSIAKKADSSGNGSITKAEAIAALRNSDLTQEQKRAVFTAMCPTVKRIPF